MSVSEETLHKRKLQASYISTIVSISLVLFMLGLLGLVIVYAQTLSNYVKENIGFSIIIKENVKEVDVVKFQKFLDASTFVKTTEYITKEEAANRLKKDLGEDFISFLGYNPLLSSIDVRLNAEYANTDSLVKLESELLKNPKIKEVFYQKNLVTLVNENVRKIGFVLLIFCGLLSIVAVALINNTIRLSVYSKRFLIKSMQLVGATQSFIRKPFILKGIMHGVYGAAIACVMLLGIIYAVQNQMPELFLYQDIDKFILLFALVFVLGIVITWLSTLLAVGKYLQLKGDDLYY